MSVVYTDIANIFTASQRINGGLGINTAPPSTGQIILTDGIFEYSRSFKQGVWNNEPFNAGNFNATVGTWTLPLGAGNVFANTWTVIGKTLIWNYNIFNTNVSTTGAVLKLTVPNGFAINSQTALGLAFAQDHGGARVITLEQASASSTFIEIFATINAGAFTATGGSADTTVFGTFLAEIQ